MLSPQVAEATRRVLRCYEAPPRLPVAPWLDEHRTLGKGESPLPGRWSTARTPYLAGPMEAFVDPDVHTIVLMFSSQVGKTELLLGTMLYAYGQDPGPGMCVLPTLELAGAVSTDRLAPALAGCDVLRDRVGTGTRKSTDAVLHKVLNAAPLSLCGANSPASLSSRPVRYLWCDEIDRWPDTTPEGDPLSLAAQRTAAYRRRKIVLTSTPTIKGASRIEDWFERSDARVYEAPCPRCGTCWTPAWRDVRWEKHAPDTAHLVCPHCNGRIEDSERAAMFAAGSWVATKPSTGIAGFRLWAVASPWVRLAELVQGFLAARKNQETFKAWVNLTLGESWDEPAARVAPDALVARAEDGDWASVLPPQVGVITMGVDTQDDRLELLVVGWGADESAWLVSREMIPGDPAHPDTWAALDEVLDASWGGKRIACALVDGGGHRTQHVYNAVRLRQHRRVFVCFGKSGGERGLLVSPPKALPAGGGPVTRHIVDVDQTKALCHSRLRAMDPGAQGFIHIPKLGASHLVSELTAEELRTTRNKSGVPVRAWTRVRERNETLDLYGYALAALRVVAPTPGRFAQWANRKEQ